MTQFFRRKSNGSEEDDIALEEQLLLPPLELPNWQPHFKPEHLKNFAQLTEAEQDLLLIFSVAAEKVDFLVKNAVRERDHDRIVAKEMISQRRWRKRLFRRWVLFVTVTSALTTTFLGSLMTQLAKRIFGP